MDVLDQSEVDALLAAVDGGQVERKAPLQAFDEYSQSGADVQVYDFKRPERVSRDQMRALKGLHEGFGRNLGAALSEYLRTGVEISVGCVEQLPYGEFIHSLANPTCYNLLKADPLDGQSCLEISPLIIYPILDRLLGGSNTDSFIPQRPLTQIEQRLVTRITDRMAHHLSETWSSLTPVTFSIQGFESNPRLAQIVPAEEMVVAIGFEVKMGNRAGTMSLCIPYNVIEPILGLLAARNRPDPQRGNGEEDVRKLTANVHHARVEMRVFLARTTICLNDLRSMQAGDIITTNKPRDGDVMIQVEGRNKFLGQIGQLRGNRVVRITRLCRQNENPPENSGEPE